MSLWKRISSGIGSEQRMMQYYEEKGLLELRVYLAHWIEDQIMIQHIEPTLSGQYETVAHKFHEDLQKKLISARTSDGALKYKAIELCAQISKFSALELYTNLYTGLRKEIDLVTAEVCNSPMPLNSYMNNAAAAAGMFGTGMNVVSPNHLQSNGVGIMQGIMPTAGLGSSGGAIGGTGTGGGGGGMNISNNMSNSNIFKAHHHLQQMNTDFEQFSHDVTAFLQAFQNYIANQNPLNSTIEEQAKMLLPNKQLITDGLKRFFNGYNASHEIVINELQNWRRQQALAGNGAPFHDNLDEIQRCFELLEFLINKLLKSVSDMIMYAVSDDLDLKLLFDQMQRQQKNLVLSAFIVEKQPPQVMKTNTRFAAAVRWLIGSQLGIHGNPPSVECMILSEAQALRFVSQGSNGNGSILSHPSQSSGEIQNNSSNMEYNQNSHVFQANFRHMQLKKIKRAEKKGTESVMDEKFALLFHATTSVHDFHIHVWTLSLPVVVIVHGNQEPQSWATITWDNAFADIMRDPFVVTDRVTWCQLSTALNTKFGSSTGRFLTRENMEFLYEKLVRSDNNVGGDNHEMISWSQFCKEPLPDRSFTFWDWFFAIMKLTKDHLLGLWKAGRVTGFINKSKAQDELMRSNSGTFLLRFSDSELGGITVGFVNEDRGVVMLSPWTARDLNIRNLADRMNDLEMLRYLHPTDSAVPILSRDEAFGEFYTQRQEPVQRVDGYVPSEIRVRVAASENGSLSGSTPHQMQSPHHMQSPQHPQRDNSMVITTPFYPDSSEMSDFDSMIY